MPTVDVRGVREREQRVARLSDLGGDVLAVAVAGCAVVALERELAHALQIADDVVQRRLFEPELIAREVGIRLVLIETRQR